MHIDGLRDACRDEWRDTVSMATMDALDYYDDGNFYDPRDKEHESISFGVDKALEVIHWTEAVAYLVESGLLFEAVRGELSYENCPASVLYDEVREAFVAALAERDAKNNE